MPATAEGQAVQPQPTYIRQPEVRVLYDHIQHVSCCFLVKDAGVFHCLDEHQDHVCPLVRLKVSCRFLEEEGGEQGQVTPSAVMVLLSWVVRAALARDAWPCWWQCPRESRQQGLRWLLRGG